MRLGKSRQLTVVFLAVLVPAATTLVWLGLRLLEQDRTLYAQREGETGGAPMMAVVERDLASGGERELAVHPDGRRVAFVMGNGEPTRYEIWAMENFPGASPQSGRQP